VPPGNAVSKFVVVTTASGTIFFGTIIHKSRVVFLSIIVEE
jgi:hypothetical protein